MKTALLQVNIQWGNISANLAHIEEMLAGKLGYDMILLPEMFASGSIMVKQELGSVIREIAEYAGCYENIRERLNEWAKRQDAVVAGSAVCKEGERFYNRMILAFPDGNFEYYDKRHCFSMAGEDEYFTAGEKHLIFEYRGVRIAVFICYDLRFPVWSRNTESYDLAVYVANWPEVRGEVWNSLLCARAIENQCFVAGVNCVGEDHYGLKYAGNSLLLDAKGRVIAGGGTGEEIVSGVLSISELREFRDKFPVLDDRDDFKIL